MKNTAIIFLLMMFSLTVFGQKPKPSKTTGKTQLAKTTLENSPNESSEKEEFDKAVNQTDAAERISALLKFVKDFPNSGDKVRAQELIVSGRAEFADEKLRSNDANDAKKGIEIFKLAVKDAPTPISDKLFSEIILQIPTNIFFRGQRTEAVEVARMIEEKISENPKQLLGLATFYIGTENAAEAKRLAGKAIELEPNLPAAYQTLGLASRLNFQLDEAVSAYSKALELDPESVVSKRSLAEMKRAVGKSDEAVELYRAILSKEDTDANAKAGLILSLFDAGKTTEAETELAQSLAQNPNDLPLLVGAAYWYAAHAQGGKAIEYGQKAVEVEPRYTWAHIALAKGLAEQNRPLEAERSLLTARQFGNFPTLDYELAAVRMMAGFYREAAEGLKKTFKINGDTIETRLGGRVDKQAANFTELLAGERQASIFEPVAADNSALAERLKYLLDFSQQIGESAPDETKLSQTTDKFVSGDDKMKLHRQLYAANRLLDKKIAPAKALELTKAAVGNVDAALNVATPAAAVLADELYDSRAVAFSRSEVVVVPVVPRQTLSNILRGRIEELSGWALYQQEKPEESVTRFKRALSVLPEQSAWWRDSTWRLGASLQNANQPAEALDWYIKSYKSGTPEIGKRIIIETLYQSVNGNLEGLDDKIGARPELAIAAVSNQNPSDQTVAQITEPTAFRSSAKSTPKPTPEVVSTPQIEPTPLSVAEPSKPSVTQTETPAEIVDPTSAAVKAENPPTVEPKPTSTPEMQPTPEITLSPAPAETQTETAKVLPAPETPVEQKKEVKQPDPVKSQSSETQSPPNNSGFDTIVITVPRNEPYKKPEKRTAKTEPEVTENIPDEKSVAEVKPDGAVKASDFVLEKNSFGQTRPRIFDTGKTEPVQPCKIVTSQEVVSILNNGGSLGVLVGFENNGDVKELTAESSSPTDIEIAFEPEIGALSGRAFYVIKSVSGNVGTFTVTFDAPCGKKDISVKVR